MKNRRVRCLRRVVIYAESPEEEDPKEENKKKTLRRKPLSPKTIVI